MRVGLRGQTLLDVLADLGIFIKHGACHQNRNPSVIIGRVFSRPGQLRSLSPNNRELPEQDLHFLPEVFGGHIAGHGRAITSGCMSVVPSFT